MKKRTKHFIMLTAVVYILLGFFAPVPAEAEATITQQPETQTVKAGGKLTFIVKAENTKGQPISWYFKNPATGQETTGRQLSEVVKGVKISNPNGLQITVSNIPKSMHGWSVYCHIGKKSGGIDSETAMILISGMDTSSVLAGSVPSDGRTGLMFETYDGKQVGKTIKTSFAEIVINEVVVNEKLEYSDGKRIQSSGGVDGKEYIILALSIKNTSQSEYYPDIGGNCTIDGNPYPITTTIFNRGKSKAISTGEKKTVLLSAEIPKGTCSKCKSIYYQLGFNDDFTMTKMDYVDSKYRYVMRYKISESDNPEEIYTKGNSDLPHIEGIQIYQVDTQTYSDKIESDFAVISFQEFSAAESYSIRFNSNSTGGFLYDQEGYKYVYLLANFKNLSKKSATPYVEGTLTIDGYEYPLGTVNRDVQSDDIFVNILKNVPIVPLATSPMMIYAEVPDELVDSFSSCKFDFYIHDSFEESNPAREFTFEYFAP